jgi:hypothetical protein
VIKYTDKELKLFCKEYGRSMSLYYFNKYIANDIDGTFYIVSNIPYEELPLHVNSMDMWYNDCVRWRLRIGR